MYLNRAPFDRTALVNGSVGIIVAPGGQLMIWLRRTIKGRKIVEIEVVADPARLSEVNLAALDE